MLKIWIIYNLLITLAILGTSFTSTGSLAQFLFPLLLLPLLYYLGKELRRKPKHAKLTDPSVFASSASTSPTITQELEDSPVLEGQVVSIPGISDDNRRLFLKLIGSTSLSIFFMAVLGKKSAGAAFFGSVPGPGTVAVKNIAGTLIDPAEAQPTDGYTITEVDDSGTTSYYGFVHKTGAWYITKEDSAGAYRYSKGPSAFASSWPGRVGLTYDYFDNVF